MTPCVEKTRETELPDQLSDCRKTAPAASFEVSPFMLEIVTFPSAHEKAIHALKPQREASLIPRTVIIP